MRPNLDAGFSPRQMNVRMMALFLSQRPDLVDKPQCALEIGEFVRFLEMVEVFDGPTRDLAEERANLLGREGRNAPAARHTGFFEKRLSHVHDHKEEIVGGARGL